MASTDGKLTDWELVHTARSLPVRAWKRRVRPVDQEFIDCAFYLYPSKRAAERGEAAGGTGFFVAVPSDHTDMAYVYAVTCKHVVDGGDGARPAPWVRLTRRDGMPAVLPTDRVQWRRHPTADVAAAFVRTADLDGFHYTAIPVDRLLTVEKLHSWYSAIRPGAQVFMVGRFMGHDGGRRNLPVVRFGHLSLVPTQHIEHAAIGKQQSFLVEMRSIGGYSGSPVFVHVMPFSSGGTTLLGVNWGHLPRKEYVRFENPDGSPRRSEDVFVQLQSTMALVAPAWQLRELLDGPDLGAARETREKRMAKEGPAAVLDAGDDKPKRGRAPAHPTVDATSEDAALELVRTPAPEGGRPKPAARKRKPKS